MRRVHLLAAWLAIATLLIGGLLPTAVAAAAASKPRSSFALCGVAPGNSPHAPAAPTSPTHPCALCAVCAGSVFAVLPNHIGFAAISSHSDALPTIARPTVATPGRLIHPDAQPRAPPATAS